MIDTKKEKPYSAAELTRILRSEYNIERSENTIRRWMREGRRGGTIRLESVMIGGQLCTSLEAYDRFHQLNQRGTR